MKRRKISKPSSQVDLNYPLDYLYPDEFGVIDEEEIDLICEHNALDLVLIENASEVFKKVMMGRGVFERILQKIIVESNRSDITYIDSERFPFYVKGPLVEYFDDNDLASSTTSTEYEYNELVANKQVLVKRALRNHDHIITILAVNLEEFGGHYVAVVHGHGVTEIFDSMQTESDDSAFSKIKGYYTPWFMQLVNDIFPGEVRVPDCIIDQLSIQLTGGFITGKPLLIEVAEKEGWMTKEYRNLLSMQSTESQNHFCYLWSIWWIHLKVNGVNFQEVLNDTIANVDPLVVIKRYGWCLVYYLDLDRKLGEYKKFFDKHFLAIWDNEVQGEKLSPDFRRYKMPAPNKCYSLNNVLNYSIGPVNDLVKVRNTPVPKFLCPTLRKMTN